MIVAKATGFIKRLYTIIAVLYIYISLPENITYLNVKLDIDDCPRFRAKDCLTGNGDACDIE